MNILIYNSHIISKKDIAPNSIFFCIDIYYKVLYYIKYNYDYEGGVLWI